MDFAKLGPIESLFEKRKQERAAKKTFLKRERLVTVNISQLLNNQERALFRLFEEILESIKTIERHQRIFYVCGGWVRDKLLKKENKGTPNQISLRIIIDF